MKHNVLEMVFILDRSGSMEGLEQETIGGFNSLIARQKELTNKAVVTTVLFDHQIEFLHDQVPLAKLSKLTSQDYYVRGSTALLDAIGKTIRHVIQTRKQESIHHLPRQTMVVITTDGMENASRYYSYEDINTMIRRQKQHYDWEFIFLGATIDTFSVAAKIGISSDRASSFRHNRQGVAATYRSIARFAEALQSGEKRPDDTWKQEPEHDLNHNDH